MRPILLGIGLLVGCAGEPSPSGAGTSVRADAAAADPALCAPHGVLSSVCPKCSPHLAAVFQAKGDWCDEHGFPESFCPICRPEQGGRPLQLLSAPTAADGPAEGMLVRLQTRQAAVQAGLAVEAAQASERVEGIEVLARTTWDAARVAAATARADGVVTALSVEVGTLVEAGQILCTLRSAEAAGARAQLLAARQAREAAALGVHRVQTLAAQGAASAQALLDAEQTLAHAEAELAAVEAEQALLGRGSGDEIQVTAPRAGLITARQVQVGQTVDREALLFEIVDAARLWAELEIPERALGAVSVGQPVVLRLEALPGEEFTAQLANIAPAVSPLTRTARARIELDNADGRLRAGLYGTAEIVTGTPPSATVVPAEAVQQAGEAHLVFVQQAADTFVVRRVRVLARRSGKVWIEGDVRAGDWVVTTGSFLLKTETLKDSIGAGCCDVEAP